MRCVNCQNEVNPGGMVCPYCHGNPIAVGSGPYYPKIEPCKNLEEKIGVFTLLASIPATAICPPVGIAMFIGSVVWAMLPERKEP